MNRIDLNARLREVIAIAQYDSKEAIKVLCQIIRDLNDEIEELRRERK